MRDHPYMRHRALVVVLWAAATTLSTVVAWRAVAVVAANVSGTAALPPAAVPGSPGPSASPPAASRPVTPTGRPPTTARPTRTAPSAAAAETRTVSSEGGTLAVRFRSGRVELVFARPRSGFTAVVTRREPTRVEVEFRSDDHVSRIRARWVGAPDVDVDESG